MVSGWTTGSLDMIMGKVSKAKFYIYRNLHGRCFSIKHKGRIIEYTTNIIAINPEFKVSEKGRQRVIKESRKNVHAYVVCSNFLVPSSFAYQLYGVLEEGEVTYNPYTDTSFMTNGKPIFKANYAQLTITNNKSKVIHGSSITLIEERATGNDNG